MKFDYTITCLVKKDPDDIPEGSDWLANIKPKSLERLTSYRVEPHILETDRGKRYQFERLGYFCVDSTDSTCGMLVFNRSVSLRDTWVNAQRKNGKIDLF